MSSIATKTVRRREGFPSPTIKRLLACLFLGFFLALMIGPQEGTQDDYGYAFRQAIFAPRIFLFLGIGLLVFVLLTFWPKISPYLHRPGVRPLTIGVITVLAAQTLLKWNDSVGTGKFSDVSDMAATANGLAPLAKLFFGWLAWALLVLVLVIGGAAIVLRNSVLAWATAALALFGIVLAVVSHSAISDLVQGIDHSLGAGSAVIGYLTVFCAAVTTALSEGDVADSQGFLGRVLNWRPGLVLAALGAVAGIIGLASATWFSPGNSNATLVDTGSTFAGQGLAPIAAQYLSWLGFVLFGATLIAAAAATYLRIPVLGWVAAALGVVSLVITLNTMYAVSALGATKNLDQATGPWQNLGTGGWMTCGAFFLLAGAGVIAGTSGRMAKGVRSGLSGGSPSAGSLPAGSTPAGSASSDKLGGVLSGLGSGKTVLFAVFAVALFYPPTATAFWQSVLVSQIGIYVLLAVGLNVVVGWAGLLDLGFIAFYAIGSYVTAYLVGSLPIKPPSWLLMTPLLAIPFAIAVCLLAGLALGAPTLRLRGDYLAIVTLGFGEIIRIVAVNADSVTNSTRGPSPQVPHPVIDIGFVRLQWGLNQLQYWYLLLVIIILVVVLFTRLERSRLGRAWAAIREDEIAAQATGVNTTKIKLMAFAIGASTSGLAGVFFASQVGYFNPDNFVLNNSILVVAYVVFGGMGSLPGAMAGAAVLTWLPEFLKDQVPPVDRTIWIGAVVLLMMIFRPAGLLPARRRATELRGLHGGAETEVSAVPAGEGMGVRA